MATRALEGIIEIILSDTEDGRWFRSHGDFFIVPFVDKDGVEDGDQGKNRRPHDQIVTISCGFTLKFERLQNDFLHGRTVNRCFSSTCIVHGFVAATIRMIREKEQMSIPILFAAIRRQIY